MDPNGPSDAVLHAFGAADPVESVPGGLGRCWRSRDVMLKPSADPEEATWMAEVLSSLPEVGFRAQRPVPSTDGSWVVAGWTAWHWLEGAHDFTNRWPEVLAAGEAFHAALRDTERPAFLDRRTHPWSIGDRAAWGETAPPTVDPAFAALLDRLYAFLEPVDLPSQVIHGDLPGNVLFADGLAPGVIDFSPYFRPSGFGLAVIIVDAIAWYGATADLLRQAGHVPCLEQLVARAAIYRLVTAGVVAPSQLPGWAATQIAAHLPILELLGA